MDEIDNAVIGAGVIGLAIARALAIHGKETILIEHERLIGSQTSSRNSEVIHAGIYYPEGSLKAQSCVEGRDRLYDYCARRGVPHRRCGKLIVAAGPRHIPDLENLLKLGHANGATDLHLIDGAQARKLEPELKAEAALLSPSTGILDSHAYMNALAADFENAGGLMAMENTISALNPTPAGIELWIEGYAEPVLRARHVINAAGLNAVALATRVRGLEGRHVPKAYLAKGSYFVLQRKSPFSHLIYPVPEPGGLGTHLTLDMAGAARFGPDVEWIDEIDYTVDPLRAQYFYESIRQYWPGLRDGDLQPDYAGIRPKIVGPGEPAADFLISGPADHGVEGLVNLFGIESPGLTASLALAARVVRQITG